MCESAVYLRKGAQESLFLQGLSVLEVDGDFIVLLSLVGEKRKIRARVIECSLVEHKVILEPLS